VEIVGSCERKRPTVAVLIRLLVIVAVLALNAILGFYRGRGIQAGDPLAFYITCSFIVVYLLYEWKNKVELIKRCILAGPFVPIFAIVFRIAGFETVVSSHFGIIIFLFLVMKTDNWKRHFFITLMTAVIFTFLLAYLRQHEDLEDLNVYEIFVIFGLGWPFAVFYGAYLVAIGSQKTIELRPLLGKAIMFAGATFLLLVLFTISHFSFRHRRFGFWISFMISVLLSLGFLGFCYRFKLSASDSSVNKFIDKLKMRFYLFRGKDEKTDKAGKCAFCGRSIYSSEVSHTIKEHTVCGQCYKKIEEEKARIT